MNTLSDVTGYSPVELMMGDDSPPIFLLICCRHAQRSHLNEWTKFCEGEEARREDEEREEAMIS
jgi:hypothetical protein